MMVFPLYLTYAILITAPHVAGGIAVYYDKYGITDSVRLHTLPAIVRFDKALNGASIDTYRRVYPKNLSSHLARYQNQSKYFHGYNQ